MSFIARCMYIICVPGVLGIADIIISNAYTDVNGPIGENMYKWDSMKTGTHDLVIDVAYPAFIHVDNTGDSDSCAYNWEAKLSVSRAQEPLFDGHFFKHSGNLTIKEKDSLDTTNSIFVDGTEGHKIAVNVRDPRSVIFSVIKTCRTEQFVSRASRMVHFMPIRREIRSLFPKDRIRFLDVFHSIWRIPTVIGRQEYGKFYLDVHDLNNLHRQNAGNRDSDHFHEGLGFLSQHLKVTRRLEESLQSMDPWIAAPYWDPTIDMKLVSSGKIKHQLDTVLWTRDFFGEPCKFKKDSFEFKDEKSWKEVAIIGGRWSMTQVPKVGDGSVWGEASAAMIKEGISVPHNAFGYLRSPWNLNPSPFVTRFMTRELVPEWSTCDNIAEGIKKSLKGTDLKSIIVNFAQFWSYKVQFPPQAHAGLHDYIGGMYIRMGVQALKKSVDDNFPSLVDKKPWKSFKHQWAILTQKGLWRSWLTEYPDHCLDGTSLEFCRPVCSNKFPRGVVGRFMMLSLLHMEAPSLPHDHSWWSDNFNFRQHLHGTKLASLSNVELEQRMTAVGDAMCDNLGVTIKGENFESSGVLDPTFWLIHPTSDRLFQMALFSMNAKLKVMKRASLTVTELADAIWPQGATYCGSIASCLTCYQIDTWLSKAIGVNQPSCLSPDETLSSTSGGGFALDTKVPAGHCCMGHGKHDQLFTSFSTNSTLAVMEGPTNKEILSILQSNLGPQWEKGGTVVYDHFRYAHCSSSKAKHNPIYSALEIPQGGTFSSASNHYHN